MYISALISALKTLSETNLPPLATETTSIIALIRESHWDHKIKSASRIRQTSDSSWEFLEIENELVKTAQNNSYG